MKNPLKKAIYRNPLADILRNQNEKKIIMVLTFSIKGGIIN